ncbi:MAG: methyltransferase domain-containing protein [Verrucomicrobiales bacterium]|nr:methyltransferase domain-containing protein [Verrucomicrobiales bacterium]
MEQPDLKTGFRSVDQFADPTYFIKFLDTTNATTSFQRLKRRTYDLLQAHEGCQLLDVGCGTGDDVRALAQVVGRTGRVVGVDNSATMLVEAQKRALGLALPVEYYLGDAHHLEFADCTFDGCRSERLLLLLDNPYQALMEMVRVTRPNGWIVAVEADWETFILAADNQPVTRKVMNLICDTIKNGWIGRNLPPYFRAQGLTDIEIITDTMLLTDYTFVDQVWGLQTTVQRAKAEGIITPDEGADWLRELEQRSRAGQFFGAVTVFTVAGRKP